MPFDFAKFMKMKKGKSPKKGKGKKPVKGLNTSPSDKVMKKKGIADESL